MSELQEAFVALLGAEVQLKKQKRHDGEYAAVKRLWGRKLDRFRHLARMETDLEAVARKLEGLQ